MYCAALCENGEVLIERVYYSTGGGFIASRQQLLRPAKGDKVATQQTVPHPFGSCDELLQLCAEQGKTIDEIILENEDAFRPREETRKAILGIHQTVSYTHLTLPTILLV